MIDQVKPRSKHPLDFLSLYGELCARYGTSPLKFSRAYVLDGILDMNIDRLRLEDWKPLLEALKENQSLRSIAVRSFAKSFQGSKIANKKIQCGITLLTNTDVLTKLCDSLAQILKSSTVLESLTLQKLPLKLDHLHILAESITSSKSLMHLSLERCPIGDAGIKEMCVYLKNLPSLEALNFSECNLTWKAVSNICDVVQYHGLMSHSNAWSASLRQEGTCPAKKHGIRRLILNGNPGVGDRGAVKLTEAFVDDLWLKELGVQHCGITDEGAHAILKLLLQNQTLSVVDMQGNPLQDQALIQKLGQTKEKNNCTQNNKHTLTLNHCNVGRGVFTTRTSTKLHNPESKLDDDSVQPSASNKEMTNGVSSPLEMEAQLNLYKRLLKEEKTAHEETTKKLNKFVAKYEVLQKTLKKRTSGNYVDNETLAQIEDTFVKLRGFLRVLKAAGLENLIGQADIGQKEEMWSNQHSSDPIPAVTEAAATTKGIGNSKTVEWTALQRHQTAEQPRAFISKSRSHTPSPDLVSEIVYNNGNFLQGDRLSKQAAIPGRNSSTSPTVLKQQHSLEDVLESKAASWVNTGQQLESGPLYSNRASGSGASDTSSSQLPIQQKLNERSSSVSLADIVSEDEF